MKQLLLVGCWICFGAWASAQVSEPQTVLGFSWGSRYKTCLQQLKDRGVPVKTVKNESITYTLAGVQTRLEFDETSELNTIVVSKHFENDPKAAQLYFSDELRSISRTFGEYDTQQAQAGHLYRYVWKLKKTAITLTYHIAAGSVTAEYSNI